MRNRIFGVATAIAVGLGLTVATAGTARAEPSGTGDYEYICVSTTGSSYSMAQGEKLSNCKGSYLQKYINGSQVESIPLDGQGTPVDPNEQLSGWCIVSLAAEGTLAIIAPPVGVVGIIATTWSGIGTLRECVA